jgi:hypothetical protein
VPARPFFIGKPGWVRSSAWPDDVVFRTGNNNLFAIQQAGYGGARRTTSPARHASADCSD